MNSTKPWEGLPHLISCSSPYNLTGLQPKPPPYYQSGAQCETQQELRQGWQVPPSVVQVSRAGSKRPVASAQLCQIRVQAQADPDNNSAWAHGWRGWVCAQQCLIMFGAYEHGAFPTRNNNLRYPRAPQGAAGPWVVLQATIALLLPGQSQEGGHLARRLHITYLNPKNRNAEPLFQNLISISRQRQQHIKPSAAPLRLHKSHTHEAIPSPTHFI